MIRMTRQAGGIALALAGLYFASHFQDTLRLVSGFAMLAAGLLLFLAPYVGTAQAGGRGGHDSEIR